MNRYRKKIKKNGNWRVKKYVKKKMINTKEEINIIDNWDLLINQYEE